MSGGPTVTVAGAGALGLSAALALADAGCVVSLWDPAEVGQASVVAAGMLAPAFEAALDAETANALDLLMAARDRWPALAARTGIEIDRSGTAAVGSDRWLAEIGARLSRLGLEGENLAPARLAALAPGIAPGLPGFLVREDWRLDPPAALQALRCAATTAGVDFRTGTVSGRDAADWLVVATGAGQDLRAIAPEVSRLSPIKGQILRFAARRGGHISVRAEDAYAVPGAAGLAVGATMEPGRTDATVDPVALEPLVRAAGRLFPDLAQASYSASAGVRAATSDGLPMVGRSAAPGLVLAVGARRNGWLLAPLAAEIVTACVLGRDPGPYAAWLDPARFEKGMR